MKIQLFASCALFAFVLILAGCGKSNNNDVGPEFDLYELAGRWQSNICLDLSEGEGDDAPVLSQVQLFIDFINSDQKATFVVWHQEYEPTDIKSQRCKTDVKKEFVADFPFLDKGDILSLDPGPDFVEGELPEYTMMYDSFLFFSESGSTITTELNFVSTDVLQISSLDIKYFNVQKILSALPITPPANFEKTLTELMTIIVATLKHEDTHFSKIKPNE